MIVEEDPVLKPQMTEEVEYSMKFLMAGEAKILV